MKDLPTFVADAHHLYHANMREWRKQKQTKKTGSMLKESSMSDIQKYLENVVAQQHEQAGEDAAYAALPEEQLMKLAGVVPKNLTGAAKHLYRQAKNQKAAELGLHHVKRNFPRPQGMSTAQHAARIKKHEEAFTKLDAWKKEYLNKGMKKKASAADDLRKVLPFVEDVGELGLRTLMQKQREEKQKKASANPITEVLADPGLQKAAIGMSMLGKAMPALGARTTTAIGGAAKAARPMATAAQKAAPMMRGVGGGALSAKEMSAGQGLGQKMMGGIKNMMGGGVKAPTPMAVPKMASANPLVLALQKIGSAPANELAALMEKLSISSLEEFGKVASAVLPSGAEMILQKVAKLGVIDLTKDDLQSAIEEAREREDIPGRAKRWGIGGGVAGGLAGTGIGAGIGRMLQGKVGPWGYAAAPVMGAAGAMAGRGLGVEHGAEEALADRMVELARQRVAEQQGIGEGLELGQGFTQGS